MGARRPMLTYCLYVPSRLGEAAHYLYEAGVPAIFVQGPIKKDGYLTGEDACARGHLSIYESLLDTAEDWAIVVEDDVELAEGFINSAKHCIEHCPDADVILLNNASDYRDAYEPQDLGSYCSYVNCPSWGTTAYLISRSGAIKMIEAQAKDLKVADSPWRDSKLFKSAQIRPDKSLVKHRGLISTL